VTVWKNPLLKSSTQETSAVPSSPPADESVMDVETPTDMKSAAVTHASLSDLHKDAITCIAFAKAFDKDYLITGSSDSTVVIYSLDKKRVVACLTGHATAVVSLQAQVGIETNVAFKFTL
jgi:WD40 repeat protein